MKKITLCFWLPFCLLSCNKKKVEQEDRRSTWTINGTAFSSGNVVLHRLKTGIQMFNPGPDLSFGLGRRLRTLPPAGYWPVQRQNVAFDASYFDVYFDYRGIRYELSVHNEDSILVSYNQEGKLNLELPAAWFRLSINTGDSVLISGIFKEP